MQTTSGLFGVPSEDPYVRIRRLRPYAHESSVKAVVDIEIKGILIDGFTVRLKAGRLSVRPPALLYFNKFGNKAYKEPVAFSPNDWACIRRAILNSVFKALAFSTRYFAIQAGIGTVSFNLTSTLA